MLLGDAGRTSARRRIEAERHDGGVVLLVEAGLGVDEVFTRQDGALLER